MFWENTNQYHKKIPPGWLKSKRWTITSVGEDVEKL